MERYHTKRTNLGVESEHFPTAPTLAQEEFSIAEGLYLSPSIAKFDSSRNE